MKKFVVLEHLCLPDRGFRFFTMNKEEDPTRLMNGTIAYKVVGYADSVEESQTMLRYNFTTPSFTELYLYHYHKQPTCYSIKGREYEPSEAVIEWATK
jgi:hypothetical protein